LDIVILARITTLPSNPPPHPTLSLSFDWYKMDMHIRFRY
jgi:hypothetical protein